MTHLELRAPAAVLGQLDIVLRVGLAGEGGEPLLQVGRIGRPARAQQVVALEPGRVWFLQGNLSPETDC
jgi:hypothetical protein